MKNIQFILLIVVVCSLGCKTQQPVIINADINNGLEPGSCYFSIRQNEGTNKESSFVLEIVPPKYEEVEIAFSKTELEKYSVRNGKHQFQAIPPHFKFILKEEDLSEFTIVENPTGYMYCMVEVPALFVMFTEEELLLKDNKVPSKILHQSKIIKRYVKNKPKKLKENQYYFEGGYWTKPKRAIATSF